MKKLSLLLALMLILTCAALAACGGEEDTSSNASSEAVSSEAASSEAASSEAASSEAASSEASSEDVSSEATSEDVSSEVVEDESSDVEAEKPVITGQNIAKGKSYEISGCGTGFGNYTANLTDGVAAAAVTYDNNWFAFYCNGDDTSIINAPDKVGTLIIDLGEVTDVTAVKISLGNSSSAGVIAPAKIRVSLSEDGKSYGDKVSMPIDDVDGTAYWSEGAITGSARYVRIQFTLDGVFAFLNEVEVYN